MLKPIDITAGQVLRAADVDESVALEVFKAMHGFYGNLFLSRFATGVLDSKQRDKGVASARRTWALSLQRFAAEVIGSAVDRCQSVHPEYPPTLPQFVILCHAARPRGRVADATNLLGMSPKLGSLYARRAREINERHDEKAAARRNGVVEREEPGPGLDALKQCIADAVASAGGDEAAELLRLDRMLARGGQA